MIRDFPHETEAKVEAITLAMFVNAVCLVGCIGCLWYNGKQEEIERLKAEKDDDDDNIEMKQSQ